MSWFVLVMDAKLKDPGPSRSTECVTIPLSSFNLVEMCSNCFIWNFLSCLMPEISLAFSVSNISKMYFYACYMEGYYINL